MGVEELMNIILKYLRKFVMFMSKEPLLTAEFETAIALKIGYWETNADQTNLQTLIKTLSDDWRHSIATKILENKRLSSSYSNPKSAAT